MNFNIFIFSEHFLGLDAHTLDYLNDSFLQLNSCMFMIVLYCLDVTVASPVQVQVCPQLKLTRRLHRCAPQPSDQTEVRNNLRATKVLFFLFVQRNQSGAAAQRGARINKYIYKQAAKSESRAVLTQRRRWQRRSEEFEGRVRRSEEEVKKK